MRFIEQVQHLQKYLLEIIKEFYYITIAITARKHTDEKTDKNASKFDDKLKWNAVVRL